MSILANASMIKTRCHSRERGNPEGHAAGPLGPGAFTLRIAIERHGDGLADLHLWRLGPGHLGAILCVETDSERDVEDYREAARGVGDFLHLTIEVLRRPGRLESETRRVA
jgi:hypothetical protein